MVGNIFIKAINEKPNIVLGLATGATPLPTYCYICNSYKKGKVSLKNVSTYNLDEYVNLGHHDKNSYYYFMHENLFNQTDIQERNIHFLNGNAKNVIKECQKYDKKIEKKPIDIQLLGIGQNGHIGFNEPSQCFSKTTFKTKLTASTIKANSRYFSKSKMPREALTMGIGTIMKAQKIILIATGKKKAKAIKEMLKGQVTPRCPASILNFHSNVEVFLDKDAASLL